MTGAVSCRAAGAQPALVRRSGSLLSLVLLVLLIASNAAALTRSVPTQYPTIQEAIVASADGDTVLVLPGTYLEHLDFLGKDVVVRSLNGPETTIVDGGGFGSVVYLGGCGEGAQLRGFTVRGGGSPFGGGVAVRYSRGEGPSITENWITGNAAYSGGGIYLLSSGRVTRCRITSNTSELGGAGIWISGEEESAFPIHLEQNEVFGNRVVRESMYAYGAGINAEGLAPYTIRGNLIACNEGSRGAGLAAGGLQPSVVEGNTMVANWGRLAVGGCYIHPSSSLAFLANVVAFNLGGGIECANVGELEAACNDVVGNNPDFTNSACSDAFAVNDNIRQDPLFGRSSGCPPAEGDFCLTSDSPLLPEHSPPGCGLIGARGVCSPNGVVELAVPRGALRVHPPRPNPFLDRTTIAFQLPAPGVVEIAIYGVLGRKVRTITWAALSAGKHELEWDGRGDDGGRAPSGAYVAVIRSGGAEVTRTLLLVR